MTDKIPMLFHITWYGERFFYEFLESVVKCAQSASHWPRRPSSQTQKGHAPSPPPHPTANPLTPSPPRPNPWGQLWALVWQTFLEFLEGTVRILFATCKV